MGAAAKSDEKQKPLTTGKVAKRFGVTSSTVRNWADNGIWIEGNRIRLKFEPIGTRRHYDPADVDAFDAAVKAARQPND